jgi:hypothetical protein
MSAIEQVEQERLEAQSRLDALADVLRLEIVQRSKPAHVCRKRPGRKPEAKKGGAS